MIANDFRESELGYFCKIKNGRAIEVHENRGPQGEIGFVAFGYLDALTRRGFCDLGTHETLQLAAETCGAFLTMPNGAAFLRFCNALSRLRHGFCARLRKGNCSQVTETQRFSRGMNRR